MFFERMGSSLPKRSSMEKILLDCDTGSDDAVALMMLLKAQHLAACVGVTCVKGNTSLHNVVMNNLRVLKLFDKLSDVPLYRGCDSAIITTHNKAETADDVFGSDGMVNQPEHPPAASDDLLSHIQTEHAVNAIISLSKKYAGELKLAATGPLTNLAMAVKLDPQLPSRLKALYVLGGSRHGKGNMTPAAEFNFYLDPEAAYITLHAFTGKCPVHLIDWDYCKGNPHPEAWVEDWLSNPKSLVAGGKVVPEKQSFLKMILKDVRQYYKECLNNSELSICDAYTMALALDPSVALGSGREVHVNVELAGNFARGALVVDHYSTKTPPEFAGPVIIYDRIDMEKYQEFLYSIVLE